MKSNSTPLLTALNFSGGKQSSALLWMVFLGVIERPRNFVVMNADPGMENSLTYEYTAMMFEECAKHEITAITAPGPNLYKDLVGLLTSGRTRVDNPPFWTKSAAGKKGRLMQKCTRHYKVAPMDRALRRILEEEHGVSRKSKRLGQGLVEKWIGFSYSEVMRIKPSRQKYVTFRYPLIERCLRNEDVLTFYKEHSLPIPPRSVCNACFANGLDRYKDARDQRPKDWAQALAVDDAIRDWSCIGVHDEVYVSQTLIPLRELAKTGFTGLLDEDRDRYSCDSGYCFT